ncbi:unnamed protein product [Porites lobata]|uniref:Uncharacterized protein n=1 Tax=Porites lobata TaxID=104759 RepID=A0ABN8NP96_9CNID|nr:unnamed protein product [Porites lobata]
MNRVANFDVCQCFPEDIMHILFEGVVPYETKRFLKVLIDEKRSLTLKELNHRMESFNYGYMHNKDKPTPIARETLNALEDAKLKQSASQMWCLFRFLPILIGDKVDVEMEEWHCLRTLWNIVQLCTAPAIRKDDVPYLRVLIEEHHTLFKRLYPEASIIPKMHYVIHIPDDIARNMCWNLLTSTGHTTSKYLYAGDVVGPGDYGIDLKQHPQAQLISDAAGLGDVPERFVGSRVKRVGIHGIEYRPGCVLRLREMDDVENDYPVYGQVDEIIVWEDEKFFILTELATLSFHHHFMAYEVERTDHKAVVLRHDLQWYGVLHIVQKNGKKFIVEKDTCCIEDVL